MVSLFRAGDSPMKKEKTPSNSGLNARNSAERLTGKGVHQSCPYYGQKM